MPTVSLFVCGRFGCVTHGLFFASTPPSLQGGTRPPRPLILRQATSAQRYKPKVVLRLSGLRVMPSIHSVSYAPTVPASDPIPVSAGCPPSARPNHMPPRSVLKRPRAPPWFAWLPSVLIPTPARPSPASCISAPWAPPSPRPRAGVVTVKWGIDGLTHSPRTRPWYLHHLAAVSAPAAAEGLTVPANRSGLAHHLPRLVAGT